MDFWGYWLFLSLYRWTYGFIVQNFIMDKAKKKNVCVYGPPTDPNFWP